MIDKSSYQVAEIAVDVVREIARLNAQIDIFWPQEIEYLKSAGLTDNKKIMDAGCGSGRYSELLLKEFPGSEIIGVEQDDHFVTSLQSLAAKAEGRFQYSMRSVFDTGVDSGSIDCVVSRLVLEHIKNPEQVLQEFRKVLKPGGMVVIIDNDFDLHLHTAPHIPELNDLYYAYCSARRNDGGNPCIGRELPHLLVRSGFEFVTLRGVVAHNVLNGDERFSRSEGSGIAAQLMHEGYLSQEIFDSLGKHWREMLNRPDHSMVRLLFMAIGIKPLLEAQRSSTSEKMSGGQTGKVDSAPGSSSVAPREVLIQKIAELLSTNVAALTMNAALFNLGMDSVAAVDLQTFLETQFGLKISITILYENKTLGEILEIIENMLKEMSGGGRGSPLENDRNPDNSVMLEGSV